MASVLYRQRPFEQRLQARLGTNAHLIRELSRLLLEADKIARIQTDASVANATRIRVLTSACDGLDARLNYLSASI